MTAFNDDYDDFLLFEYPRINNNHRFPSVGVASTCPLLTAIIIVISFP